MTTRFISLLMAVSGMGTATLFAQDGAAKAVERTLMLEKKSYTLKHALAYETTIDNEEAIGVVLSNQAVSSEQLKEAREGEKEGQDSEFKRPFFKLEFKKTGTMLFTSHPAPRP